MNRLLARTSVIAICAAWSLAVPQAAFAEDAAPVVGTAASMPTTLEGQIQRAKDLRAQGDVTEAQRSLAQLMLVAPDDARVVGEYGKTLVQQGDGKDAVSFLTRAVQLNGSDWTLYSALGIAYDQMGDRNNARKSYDRALAMKPGDAAVLNNYAMSRMLAGDYDGAVQMFAQIQANGGDNPKIAANLARAQELKSAHDVKMAAQAKPKPAMAEVALAQGPSAPSVKTIPPLAPAPKSDAATIVMQKVPVDPLAGPTRKAQAVATSAPHTLAPAKTVVAGALQSKIDPSTTVMQRVPVDPQAGPVAKPATAIRAASKAPAKDPGKKSVQMAKALPAKPAAKLTPPPSLRTAAD
jgi:Flp pilus assembly protein TadD